MKTKNKLQLLKGLPCSGKSTHAKQLVLDDHSFVRINRDDLRAMFFNMRFSNDNEKFVTKARDLLMKLAADEGKSLVVDETSLNPSVPRFMKSFAENNNLEFEIKEFDKDVEQCIDHDSRRPNPVGHKVILQMYRKYIEPKFYKKEIDENKPTAIISDIDGTVALCLNRNPYNTAMSLSDEPNYPIIESLVNLREQGYEILFVTGREEKFRDITFEWLNKYIGGDYKVFMRPTGDKRRDYEVKEEILKTLILTNFNVLMAYEDRPRNSRMYRRNNIQPIHVGINVEW